MVVVSSTPGSLPCSSPNLRNVEWSKMRSSWARLDETRYFLIVRILWVEVGEICHVVTVLIFVKGSKWTSGEERGTSRRGDSSAEGSESKSETSNQSRL